MDNNSSELANFPFLAEILPNQLFLTDFENAQLNLLVLQPNLVINAAASECIYSDVLQQRCFEVGTIIWSLDIKDNYGSDISQYFHLVADRIENVLLSPGGKVLIHCFAGKSRSAALLIAYLIKYRNYSLNSAMKYVGSKRDIMPNMQFIRFLLAFEAEMREKENSVEATRDSDTFDMKIYTCKYVLGVLFLPQESISVVESQYDEYDGDFDSVVDAMLSFS